jgi:hypothetical protein
VQHELAAGCAGIGGDDRGLDPELIGRAGLALADALDLRRVEGIKLPAALALLLVTDLAGSRERGLEHCRDRLLASNLAPDVADNPAEPRAQDAQLSTVAVELLGVGVALRGFRCQNLAISKQPKHKNPNLAQRLTSYSRPTSYTAGFFCGLPARLRAFTNSSCLRMPSKSFRVTLGNTSRTKVSVFRTFGR